MSLSRNQTVVAFPELKQQFLSKLVKVWKPLWTFWEWSLRLIIFESATQIWGMVDKNDRDVKIAF